MKISKWILVGGIIIIVLILFEIAQLLGIVTYQQIIASFWAMLVGLVAIAILSIIGGIFVGMYLTHKIFTRRSFTPFEIEMLKMKTDINGIKEKLEKMEKSLMQRADNENR